MKSFLACLAIFVAFSGNSTAQTTRATTAAGDGGWPRAYVTTSGAHVVLYQPQIESWTDQKKMTMYAAVSYQAAGEQKPALGTFKIECDTKVALAERLVNFSDITISEASFPTLGKDVVKSAVMDIVNAIPRDDRVLALDRVLAAVDTSQISPKNVEGLKADPPKIFVSETPAVMLNLDGDPVWSPIAGNNLKFAVNTNWDLFEDPTAVRYYLRVDKSWLTATSITGPWTATGHLPADFSRLPADANWAEVKAALPAKRVGQAPTVFVSTTPAELMVFTGPPKPVPIQGTRLVWLSNTESDVFRFADGPFYYLVSGRWFSAPRLTGPWTFTTPNLPDDFDRLPLDHPRSRVLASVPGTRQALEAVLLSQVPQTARVNRKDVHAPAVSYQGTPQFEMIEQTQVSRAVNTDKDILRVGDRYYMCYEGVWFYSASPSGPWQVSDSVPGEIYEIPISSPAHDVTYVTVEGSDENWVDYAAAAGYTGLMVGWGVAMWGSGYYYPPYIGWSGLYPAYFPAYPSYGYGARYNPWSGTYSRGAGVYGPYGGAGFGARYNPVTGTYARGAAAYGPLGSRGAVGAYNPRTGTRAAAMGGSNVYGSWRSSGVQRGDQWATTSRVTRNATGTTGRVTRGSGGGGALTTRGPSGSGMVGRTGGGDVYAGRDGNVYRQQGGSWQKYGGGGWNDVNRPVGTSGALGSAARDRVNAGGTTFDQLNRDRGARFDGSQRLNDFSRGSGLGSGSYRPSGGFGGGGRSFGGGGRSFGGGGRSFGGGGMRGGGMRGGGGRR